MRCWRGHGTTRRDTPGAGRRQTFLVAVGTVLALSACGSHSADSRQAMSSGAVAAPTATYYSEELRIRSYSTFDQLATSATSVAIITATDVTTSSHDIGPRSVTGVPYTITTVKVDRTVKGALPETIPLYQGGTREIALSDGTPLVQPGHQYLLWTRERGFGSLDAYAAIGPGLYEITGTTLVRLESPAYDPDMPRTAELSMVLRQLDAASSPSPETATSG
jgi:hypothetical protein